MKTSDKWVLRWLDMAQLVASWSKDPDKKVGAVVVAPNSRQFSPGFNGLPAGVADTEDRLTVRSVKLDLMVHAELNAILNARRDLTGWTMYCTKHPCVDCAKAIIQAGLVAVVCETPAADTRWKESNAKAAAVLAEAGVTLRTVSVVEEPSE